MPRRDGKKKVKDKRRSPELERPSASGFPRVELIEGSKTPAGPIFIRGYYDRGGVWVVLMGGDFEAFVDNTGQTTAFRRRSTYRELVGEFVPRSEWGSRRIELPPEEFETALTSHLALAVRRCVVREDVLARSSELVKIINKAMSELETLRDANMRQTYMRTEIETIRIRMFTRLMSADLRKGPPVER